MVAGLSQYLAQFQDPYERKARLYPGLLVVAPIVVALTVHLGVKHRALGAVGAVFGACGGMYGIASIVRAKGKELEEKLVAAWGGLPTTIALRHRDQFLDSASKQRYHDLITRKLGITMPTADEERTNPTLADDVYVGATKRLRELTRSDKGLLFKENISYGFHRNMLAMKPVGVAISVFTITYGLAQAKVLHFHAPHFELDAITDIDLHAAMTLAVGTIFLLGWLLYINRGAVLRIGYAYAERLFERLPSLKGPRK
jgi:hypothetical protein